MAQWQDEKQQRESYRRERYGEIARVENIGLNRNAILEKRDGGMVALVQETVTPTDPGVTVAPQHRDLLKTTPGGMLNVADFFNREDVYNALLAMAQEQEREQAHGNEATETNASKRI